MILKEKLKKIIIMQMNGIRRCLEYD